MKILVASTVASLALATSAFAEGHSAANNGQGGGKGRDMATDVSNGGGADRGDASVAAGLKGGWGGNAGATGGQVSSGPAAAPKE
ncbi:hypothetical protein H9Q16_08765 [Sulfitobacter sp. TSTF-M16]|uniref:Uncharacterized protein n=1 Tax=Sulfitobacter aestuariivivens TaxID=2766981 RepID=A0A927D2V3_9RHOB|nr:hypothetical protein [Sulfitobacter aestuariivivens]